MKKVIAALLMASMSFALAACGRSDAPKTEGSNPAAATEKKVDKLRVGFVPSRQPEQIIAATEPLKKILKEQLGKRGFDIGEVEITVGTSYEAVGEALASGTNDVGLIPGGTYVLFENDAEVILTSTRAGLNNDSDNPKDWNENKPTGPVKDQVKYYRSLIIAGPSEKGRELAAKVNKGEKLTWEDLDSANWSVTNSSSSAGYIYPSLWLKEHYGKSVAALGHAVQSDSYGSSFARLASGQVDLICIYGDARRDYVEKWTQDYGRTQSIWEETDVVGVTPGIYNDTVSVSKNSKIMNDDLKQALAESFIEIAQTEEGREIIKIYNHEGYAKAEAKDYDSAREAQKLVRESKK